MSSTIEHVLRNATARQARLIDTTPEALRIVAARLEAAAKGARAGESVLCDLTPSITLIFRPEREESPLIQSPEYL